MLIKEAECYVRQARLSSLLTWLIRCSRLPSVWHRWQDLDSFFLCLSLFLATGNMLGVGPQGFRHGGTLTETHLERLCLCEPQSVPKAFFWSDVTTHSFSLETAGWKETGGDRDIERKVRSGIYLLQIRGSVIVLPCTHAHTHTHTHTHTQTANKPRGTCASQHDTQCLKDISRCVKTHTTQHEPRNRAQIHKPPNTTLEF